MPLDDFDEATLEHRDDDVVEAAPASKDEFDGPATQADDDVGRADAAHGGDDEQVSIVAGGAARSLDDAAVKAAPDDDAFMPGATTVLSDDDAPPSDAPNDDDTAVGETEVDDAAQRGGVHLVDAEALRKKAQELQQGAGEPAAASTPLPATTPPADGGFALDALPEAPEEAAFDEQKKTGLLIALIAVAGIAAVAFFGAAAWLLLSGNDDDAVVAEKDPPSAAGETPAPSSATSTPMRAPETKPEPSPSKTPQAQQPTSTTTEPKAKTPPAPKTDAPSTSDRTSKRPRRKKVAMSRKLLAQTPLVVRVNARGSVDKKVRGGLRKGLLNKVKPKVQVSRRAPPKGYRVDVWLQKLKRRQQGKTLTVEVHCSLTASQLPGKAMRMSSRAEVGGQLTGGDDAAQQALEVEVAQACGAALADDVVSFAKKRSIAKKNLRR